MRLAIFGYPRSGTSYLYDIIERHLLAAGVYEPHQILHEAVNRREHHRIVPFMHNGEMVLRQETTANGQSWDPVMTRAERFDLLEKFSGKGQDYFIKVLSTDTRDPRVFPWMVENYPVITICRHDHFDAFISWLIARRHDLWNRSYEAPADYEPFKVREDLMHHVVDVFYRYFKLTHTVIPNRKHIYYEDMIEMSPKEVLEHCGVYQEGYPAPPSVFKKLLTLPEKLALIENLPEVLAFYQRYMKWVVR